MTKFFKSKAVKAKEIKPEPRTMVEVEKSYSELCARAGQLQYKMKIDQEQMNQINEELRSVNIEASLRQKLDLEAAKAKESEQGAKNE